MKIQLKITHDVSLARRMGWTKNHKLVEMFVASKYRVVGFFTQKQIDLEYHIKTARQKLITNGNFSKEDAEKVIFV